MRVFILAPNLAVRVGLRALLEMEAAIQVVGEAAEARLADLEWPEVDVLVWSPAAPPALPAALPGLGSQAAVLLLSDDPAALAGIAKTY